MAKPKTAKPPAKTPKAAIKDRIAKAAERALAEAQARRRAAPPPPPVPAEQGGAKGPEPTRYGDWEKKGLISDF
jgi:hypothetical protein